MNNLTKRQKETLNFVEEYISENDYAPSLEEIAKGTGVSSPGTVSEHIESLESKGYLRRDKGQPRSIELLEGEPMVQVPLLGLISAGQPIEAIEDKETIVMPEDKLPKSGNVFALKVVGTSMVEENINDGDIVIVKEQKTAQNGQRVVALIDNQDTTLKKFYKEKGQIRLQPANKKLEPIFLDENTDFQVQGIIIDVIKATSKPRKKDIVEKTKTSGKRSIKKHLNKVFLGDVMDLLAQLPDNSVDMIFGDPDYNVGVRYGDKTYTKNFNDYIDWYIKLTKECMRVLKENGNFFTINYPKQNAHLRVKYLDENYPLVSEYVWIYNTNVGHTPRRFTTAHRSILHARKSKDNKFYKDNVALPYLNPTDKRILRNLENGSKGRMPYSWMNFNLVKNVSKEKTYHACQIPQKLTETLIKASTQPEDTVFVLFGGSGSETDVCKQLNRNFLSAEIDPKYHKLISDRLEHGYIREEYKLKNGRRQEMAQK